MCAPRKMKCTESPKIHYTQPGWASSRRCTHCCTIPRSQPKKERTRIAANPFISISRGEADRLRNSQFAEERHSCLSSQNDVAHLVKTSIGLNSPRRAKTTTPNSHLT